MNKASPRSGVMTLRTLGRGFWLGLAASIGLHAALLSTGTFTFPKPAEPRIIEARLEVPETQPVLPAPDVPVKAAEPSASQATAKPLATKPVPPAAAANPPDLAKTATASSVPPATENEAAVAPPLPDVAPPPPDSRPHAVLSQAANSLRELPRQVEITYQLKGMVSGRQTQTWRREGPRYAIESSAEATGLAAMFLSGRIVQKSSGHIGPLGLLPERYEMQRFAGKSETLLFKYDDNVIEASRIDSRKGSRTTELPLLTGAQDPLSSIFQLAMVARENSDGVIVAAGAKRVKGYPYRTLGTEAIQTPLGTLQALHVTRAGDAGKDTVHLWLAIEHRHLPVRITYTDDDGTDWALEAVSIKVE